MFDGFRVTEPGPSPSPTGCCRCTVHVKPGDVRSAQEVFDAMVARDAVSWNAMLNPYVKTADVVATK